MSNAPINVRFTDENYATRLEVAKILNSNLIDPIWNDILRYRATMQRKINVFDITHTQLIVTETERIKSKISAISQLNSKYADAFAHLLGGSASKSLIQETQTIQILKYIAKQNALDFSENILKDVLAKHGTPDSCQILSRYLEALEVLSNSYQEKVDEEFLAKYLGILRGEQELTSFYRLDDIKTESSLYLVSKEYEAAPAHEIEVLMNSLFEYLQNPEENLACKIGVTLYMFEFVRPFDKYSREISFIVCKKLIADAGANENAIFIPLENIIVDPKFYSQAVKDIQRTRDLTYGLNPAFDSLEKAYTAILDKVVQTNGHDLRQTFYAGDSKEKFEEEFNVKPAEGVIVEEEKPVKKEEPKPAIEPKPQVFAKQTTELSEKELKQAANEMMESNPFIKKAQAHFYVRHNTPGKYYTIQEFKKCERVVYETARTSMDNLAEQGFYKKEQIKNKFVYTPVTK